MIAKIRFFGSDQSVFNAVLNYELKAKGKRTIVYNNSTKTNLKVYNQFKEKGYDAKLYDSVNETEDSRKQIVKWFRETDGAILLNCGVFVAGLDVKEIECVLLNVATQSLSRYLQMCGRGGRFSSLIYKPFFLLLDGGGNVDRFQKWSTPRDWRKIFFEGIGKDRPKKETPLSVSECKECGYLFPRSESTCPECGWTHPVAVKKEAVEGEMVLSMLEEPPLPKGESIANYAVKRGEDIHFAFKVLYEQILDLFRFHGITKANYESNLGDGRLEKRLGEIIRPVYFVLIGRDEFKSDTNRTLKYVINKAKEKIKRYYE